MSTDPSLQKSSITPVNTTDTAQKWNDMIDYLNMGLGAITFIVSPAIILASWLMSPDWTSGDLFGLREVMHNLWITVSNILYFVYAILLIIIALATMFNQEKFGYKVMLPKLALGIILVPFTWWFVQWTISLAAVVTASVVSIPTDTIAKVMDSTDSKVWYNRGIIPTEIIVSDTTTQESFNKSVECSEGETQTTPNGKKCIAPKEFLTKYGWMWSPLVVYAYGVFKFDKIEHLNTSLDVVQAAIQLVHKWIIWALMFMVFGILVIALIFMLLMRAVKLWFYAIFSPLFTLHFVVGKELMGDKSDNFSLKEFIGLAFVPAVVGITLSFWLVIITAIYNPISKATSTGADGKNELVLFGNPNNKITSEIITENNKSTSQTTVMIGDVKWIFKGSAVNTGDTNTQVYSAIDSAGNVLGTIIIDIIALVFIWAAFMAAKWVSKAVDAAVQPFENMGKKIGELGMSLPKYTPLPLPGGSVAGMNKAINVASNIPEQMANKKFEESDLGKKLTSMSQAMNSGDVAKIKQALNETSWRSAIEQLTSATREMVNAGKWSQLYASTNAEHLNKLSERVNKWTISESEIKLFIKDVPSAEKLYKLLKDKNGNLDENDRKIVAALMAWARYDITPIDAEKFLKAGGTTSSSNSSWATNNTFNIVTNSVNWTTTYELNSANLKASWTPEQIKKALTDNISKIADIDEETLKKELREIWKPENWSDNTAVDEIIQKVKAHKSGTPKP